MQEQQVVIIGAGVLGLGTALALAQHEHLKITVVERGHPGSGSTGLAVGMAVRAHQDPTNLNLARRAYEILEDLERDAGLTLRRIGHFMPGRTHAEIETFRKVKDDHAGLGWTATEVLDRGGIERAFPEYTIPGDVIGAFWDPDAAFIDGTEITSALAEAVKARGVTVVPRTKITSFGSGSDRSKYVLGTESGAVFPADVVVNVAGAWGAQVGEMLGAPLQVMNERHEAYFFRHHGLDRVLPMFLDYIPGHSHDEGLYFRGEGSDGMLAGMHSSQLLHPDEVVNPDDVSQRVSEDHLEQVFGLLADAFPNVEIGFDKGYAGIYPHHAQNRYVIGRHPANADIFVGAGLGGRGLGPGVALGEVLAEKIVYGESRTIDGTDKFSPNEHV